MFLVLEFLVLSALIGCCAFSLRSYGILSLSFVSSVLISLYWLWFFGPLTNLVGAFSPQHVENPSSDLNWNIYPPLFDRAILLAGVAFCLALFWLNFLPLISRLANKIASLKLPLATAAKALSLRVYAFVGTLWLAVVAFRFGSSIGTEFFDLSALSIIDKAIVSSYFQVPCGPAIALALLAIMFKKRALLLLIIGACIVNILCFIVFRQRLYCLISCFSLFLALGSLFRLWNRLDFIKIVFSSALLVCLLAIGYAVPTALKGQFGPSGFTPKVDEIQSHILSLHRRFYLDFGYRLSGLGSASTALRTQFQIRSGECLHRPEVNLLNGPLASEMVGSLPGFIRQPLGFEPSRLPEYLIGQCYGRNQVDLVETQALPFFLQFNAKLAIFFLSIWLCLSRVAISVLLWVLLRIFSVDVAGFLLVPLAYLGVVTGGVGEFMAFAKVLPALLVLYALPSALLVRWRFAR